jgi:hypothetical protein
MQLNQDKNKIRKAYCERKHITAEVNNWRKSRKCLPVVSFLKK